MGRKTLESSEETGRGCWSPEADPGVDENGKKKLMEGYSSKGVDFGNQMVDPSKVSEPIAK